jgi:hypothetical protein
VVNTPCCVATVGGVPAQPVQAAITSATTVSRREHRQEHRQACASCRAVIPSSGARVWPIRFASRGTRQESVPIQKCVPSVARTPAGPRAMVSWTVGTAPVCVRPAGWRWASK